MKRWSLAAALALCACDVPEPPGTRGVTDVGLCPTSLVVVESDYESTNVALVAMDGRVLTGSVASSAMGLGRDVVLPAETSDGSVVLIDRLPEARLVWIDPTTARVTSERSVTTGFPSNPRDYAAIASTRAYVTRYEQNLAPSTQPFDRGSDVLVVDPEGGAIVGSIDMRPAVADAPGALPRPDRIAIRGDRAFVLLATLGTDFTATFPSRIVEIDTRSDRITSVLPLTGFTQCAGLEGSPFGPELVVNCLGTFQSTGSSTLSGSGIVVVDVSGSPTVSRSFRALDLGSNPVGFESAWAGPDAILFQTFGHFADGAIAAADDVVYRLDLRTGEHEAVLASDGEAFSLGGIACEPACGACFVADAGRGGVVHRFDVDEMGVVSSARAIVVERAIGLPPRELGKVRL